MRHLTFAALLGALLMGCKTVDQPRTEIYAAGGIERLEDALDRLIAPGTKIEKLAEGFDWSEGPVWMKEGEFLLFSDVPRNTIIKWERGKGASDWMKPSGYAGPATRRGEPGSNGLTRDLEGRLVLCEHGDRRISRLEKNGRKTTIADRYEGKRFNSPNDVVFDSAGNCYFTDPPYGLEGGVSDPKKELPFQGVYRVTPAGKVTLLTGDLSRPNGIALSPDQKTLYVANSDRARPVWMAFELLADGTVKNGRVLFDATPLVNKGLRGLPDGLKVDELGNLWATGPGGVLVLSPQGRHLGTILTGQATGNCAFGDDGTSLYITADMYLLRVPLKTRGNLP